MMFTAPAPGFSSAPLPEADLGGTAPATGVRTIPPTRISLWRRTLPILLLICIVSFFALVIARFHTNSHFGTDQNGYLMTARHLVEEGRLWFVPENPYQFAGNMCIMTKPFEPPSMTQPTAYRIYAKYPFGYPVLAALARWLAGIDAMYLVNPICTVAALWMSFFLFRQALTPLLSLLGTILLATNPLTLVYANDANSHASMLLCVIVGFWGLLSWWKKETADQISRGWMAGFNAGWRGLIGGLALGCACTIRYTEGLLILPVLFGALTNLRWNRRRVVSCGLVVLGWAIPVAVLAGVCWVHFGAPWHTGYTFCKEDTGFAWKYFIGANDEPTNSFKQGNWATLIQQLNVSGLFALWPLALVGLLVMLSRAWRLGGVLFLWVVPSTILYLFYYWAPQGDTTVGYLRFFLDVVPGLIFAALWLAEHALERNAAPDLVAAGPPWPGLILVTLVGLGMAGWIVYYYSPGVAIEPNEITWGVPAPGAWRYFVGAGLVLLCGAIWIWERPFAARGATLVVGCGVLVALASSVNLLNILPQLENNLYANNAAWSQTIAAVRAAAPSGAVLFAEEPVCNQLDAWGGYQLYSLNLSGPLGFNNMKKIVEKRVDSNIDDPNPIQWERAKFYTELLGKKTDSGVWTLREPRERNADQIELLRRAAVAGQRILVLLRSEDRRYSISQIVPTGPGISQKQIARWFTMPAVVPDQRSWFVNQPFRRPGPPGGPNRNAAGQWVLYEVFVDPAARNPVPVPPPPPTLRRLPVDTRPSVVPTSRPALTRPATLPATQSATTRPGI